MEKQQLNQIKHLLTYLTSYRTTGKMKIEHDDQLLLRNIYMEIYKVKPNIGCPTCVSHYLHMLESYYERERSKIQPEVNTDQIWDNNNPGDVIPTKKKSGRKKDV